MSLKGKLTPDSARPARKIAGFIEPHRVAFVAPLVLKKFGFILRRGDGLKTQSADRIVVPISVQSVRKVRLELIDHGAPLHSNGFVVRKE